MVRKLCKIAMYVGLTLAILALLAYVARDPLRDALVRTVSARLSTSLHGSLHIGKLRGSLLTSLVLQDIVLRDQQGVVAQLKALRLVYNPLTLLKGQFTVYGVDIVRPQLTLVQTADGDWNITRILPSALPSEQTPPEPSTSGKAFPLAVVLARVQIHDGEVALRTPSLPGVQHIEALQMRLEGHLDRQGVRLDLQQLTARATPANVEIRTLRGTVQGLPGNLHIDQVRVQTDQTLITVDGVLPGGTQPASLALAMQPLDVTEIGRVLHNDALRGLVQMTLRVEGPPDALEVHTELHAEGGRIDLQARVDTTATPLRYHGTLDMARVNVAAMLHRTALQSDINLRIRLDGEGLTPGDVRGHVQLEVQPSHVGTIALRPSRIDLEAQPQHIQVRGFTLDTSIARMTVSGAVNLADRSDLRYQVVADLAHLRQLLGLTALGGDVELQGEVTGELQAINARGTLQVSNLLYQEQRLRSLQLTYEGTQLGTQPQVTARLLAHQARAGTLPVEQLEAQATYDGATRQVRFTTEVRQSSGYSGETTGTVTLVESGQDIVLETLVVRLADRVWRAAMPLEVALGTGRIHLKRFRLVHANESLEVSGGLDGQRLQDLHLDATQIDLTFLRRLGQLPDMVGGRATLKVRLTGTLAEPLLQGELALDSESPRHLPFERFVTALTYEHKQFQTDMRIQQANREILTLQLRLPVDMALTNLPLEQRLIDAPVALRVVLDRPNLTALRRWQPTLPQLSGTLQGTLALQGTYTALNLDTQIQLQQLGVQSIIEQVSAPVHLTGDMVTASSLQELGRMVAQGQLAPTLQKLECRMPRLRGQLPGHGTPPQPVLIQDLLVQADGQWRPEGLQATLHTLRLQASAPDFPPLNLVLAGRVTPQQLELKQLQIRLPQSEIRGRGALTLDSQQLRFHVDMPRLRLEELARTFPSTLPPEIQGTLEVQGSLQAPTMVTRLQYAGAQISADLTAQLQETLPRYTATLRIDGLDTARVLPGAQGQLQALLRLQGAGFTGEHRRARLDLNVDSSDFSLLPALEARLQARLEGEAVRLEDFRVHSVPVKFQAHGALSATRHVDLAYALTLGDLQAMQKFLGLTLQAQGSLSGEVQGPLNAIRTHGTLQLDEWGVVDFRGKTMRAVFSAADLPAAPQATIDMQLEDIQGASLPSSSISLEGTYRSPQGTFAVNVTKGPYEKTLLAGNVVLQEGQQLRLDRLRMQGHGLVWENDGPIEVVRDARGVVQLRRLLLRSGEQEISAQGTLAPEGAVAADIRLQKVQIQPTVHAVAPAIDTPDGQLALDLRLKGTVKQPQLEGNLALTALQWRQHNLGEVRAVIGLIEQTLRTDLRWQDQSSEVLHLHGSLGMGPTGALALQLQAPGMDMHRLTPLSPAVLDSAGTLMLDLRLAGTLQQPQVHGHLELRDGVLRLAATGERYRDMQARLLFAGDRVDIERLHVGSRSGPLQLTGRIETTGRALRQVDLTVQAQEFTAMHTEDMQAVISAAVKAVGSLEEMNVTGNITVPRARFRLTGKLGGGPAAVEPWELTVEGVYGSGHEASSGADGTVSVPGQPAPLPFLRTNLAVDIPRNAWVQGPGTAVEIRGNLQVTKDLQAPFIVSGAIETVRGFASFYGKKFVLQNGRVTFPGTEEINPVLDVTTTHEVSDYVVSIHVEGKAKQPELMLSSQPELEQADIVSLLVFGKTTDRLTSSEQSALSSQTQAIAGSVAARELEKTVGKTLGLDTIELKPGEKLGTGSVGVGRYITQDIFLSYERKFDQRGGNKVGVEYSINRKWKLKGSSSDYGESALDLFWQLDY